jgi:hypothetical protein
MTGGEFDILAAVGQVADGYRWRYQLGADDPLICSMTPWLYMIVVVETSRELGRRATQSDVEAAFQKHTPTDGRPVTLVLTEPLTWRQRWQLRRRSRHAARHP